LDIVHPAWNDTTFHFASLNGAPNSVTFLTQNGFIPDLLSLQYAIKKNQIECVKAMLPHFPHKLSLPSDKLSPLLETILFGRNDIFELLLPKLETAQLEKILFLSMNTSCPKIFNTMIRERPQLLKQTFKGLSMHDLAQLCAHHQANHLIPLIPLETKPNGLNIKLMLQKVNSIPIYQTLRNLLDLQLLETYFKVEERDYQNVFLDKATPFCEVFQNCVWNGGGSWPHAQSCDAQSFSLETERKLRDAMGRWRQCSHAFMVISDNVDIIPALIHPPGDRKSLIVDFKDYLPRFESLQHKFDSHDWYDLQQEISKRLYSAANEPPETVFLVNPDLIWDMLWMHANRNTASKTSLFISNEVDCFQSKGCDTFICVQSASRFCPSLLRRVGGPSLETKIEPTQLQTFKTFVLLSLGLPATHTQQIIERTKDYDLVTGIRMMLIVKYLMVHSHPVDTAIAKATSIIEFCNLKTHYNRIITSPKEAQHPSTPHQTTHPAQQVDSVMDDIYS